MTGFLLDASLVLPLGFFLRWHRLNTETMSTRLRQAKEEVAQVETRIRQDLATELHDTIARDLVRLVVLANRLEKHPDSATSEDFRLISELSTSASRGIRPVISGLDKRRSRKNITQIIEEVASMLSARDMKLRTVGTSKLDALLTRQQLLLATLMIQECATNALKYGVPGTEVVLEAILDESRVLILTMRNEISPTPNYAGVSSGFGLNNLESRLNEESGELFFGKVEQQWITKAVIPLS
ncbi:histidine kinase [Mobiluncus mulieris]|uniref:histidine kinase n=1 Tax=Mobiluncus mulieris TaxID=2052 RepID=UPI00215D9AB5|nr:histidine kinase [Mobiluncus mulieris]